MLGGRETQVQLLPDPIKKVQFMNMTEFIDYVYEFYGPDSDLYPMGATKEQIQEALNILITREKVVHYDSISREQIRDIMIERFGLVFPGQEHIQWQFLAR